MNRSQAIGGMICLLIAAFLTVVYVRLPADKLMFMVGDSNIPLPPIILAVAGVLLLVTAIRRTR